MQDRGHVSLLLWGILLVLALTDSSSVTVGVQQLSPLPWSSGSPRSLPGKGSTGSFGSLTTPAQPCQRTPELSISQLLWDNIPFPSAQPQSLQQCWGSPSWGLGSHPSLSDQHMVSGSFQSLAVPCWAGGMRKAWTLSSLQGVGRGGVSLQSHLGTDL